MESGQYAAWFRALAVIAERRGTAGYRINDRCVACFPTAADIVMGRPAPGAAVWARV